MFGKFDELQPIHQKIFSQYIHDKACHHAFCVMERMHEARHLNVCMK